MSSVPNIRFKGFDEDWEQRKFGDIFTLSQGLQIPISNRFVEDGPNRYFYITNEFLKDNSKGTYFIENPSPSVICDEEDILMTRTGNTGIIVTDVKGCYHNNFFKINYDKADYDKKFICSLLSTENMQKSILRSAGSSTIPDLSHKSFYKLDSLFPQYTEQRKISKFLCNVTDLIIFHQRKCDEIKTLKKYMLQKMFPKEGKNIPEIRFEGFNDPWEQRKLGELGTLKNGMNFSKDAMGHGYAFINLQNIFGKSVIDIQDLELAEASKKQLIDYSLKKGDVLFVRSSVKLEGVGEAALVPETLENTTYSGFIIRFRDEYGLNNDFKKIVFTTKKVRDQIMSQATNSANKNISQKVLENLNIEVPSYNEQEKIGEYFNRLDNLITLHQRKCDELKEVKKFMLSNMFPKEG